jgi:hypothetical protein
MSPRLKKALLVLLAGALLAGSSFVQRSLNADRERLGLTRIEPLDNAPPVLAFTTVALGGFRGLISNALWARANDLQDDDKFFEMAQLADWITKLEPHFVQVWIVQAWNMAYNISVKFKETAPGQFPDRWRWLKAGIELLRDQGLVYNPNEVLLYRELGWFFQHKLGANLDDAHMYYKQQWANEMAEVFGKGKPNLDELIHPQTDDQKARATLLREKYRLDPEFMKEVDERYGPLEWRLPEAHAIYWAARGLKAAAEHPTKVKSEDLINLRRVIYQSMQLSFQRGRLIANPFVKAFEFGPNLDIIPKVSAAYEQAAKEDEKNSDHILRAHRNFLRDAVYFLYEHNRRADAQRWFQYLAREYPDRTIIDNDTNSFPRNVTLEQYAIARTQVDLGETDVNRIKSALEGFFIEAYRSLVIGEDELSLGYRAMAHQAYDTYSSKIEGTGERVKLPPLDDLDREVLRHLLDPEGGVSAEWRAALRTRLNLPPEPPPPATPASTNAVSTSSTAPKPAGP